jgi:hypothetical protein
MSQKLLDKPALDQSHALHEIVDGSESNGLGPDFDKMAILPSRAGHRARAIDDE